MPIELACNTLNYAATSFTRALEGIARAGFKYVGVGATHEKKRYPNYQISETELREMKSRIDACGLKVNSCLCFEVHIGPDESVDQFRRELDNLAALGCKRAIIGGPWYYAKWPTEIYAPDVWQRACDQFYSCMDKILPHAEKLGIVICVKPHTGLVAHSGRVREVRERLRSPSLSICWDAGNVSFYEGVCPDPGLDKVAPFVRAVCLKDHKGPRAHPVFPPLGEGNVDHDEFFGVLAKGGFNDVLMIERLGVREGETLTPEQIDERGVQSIEFLTPLLKKHFGTSAS
jgi:sugar phosphate isomerase/epimerase